MAFQQSREFSAASETGTVLSREELRRRLSEQSSAASETGTALSREEFRQRLSELSSAASETGTVLSREEFPQRLSEPIEASALKRSGPVTSEDSTNSENPGRHKTVEFTMMSGPVQKRSSQGQVLLRGSGELDADVRLCENDHGKVQGILELSTLRQVRKPLIKVRVICLIDTSGSMLLSGDARNSRSKISILKNMAVDIIDALEDDEDSFGVMTFGEESKVICPLTKVSTDTRIEAKERVSELDRRSAFSAVTDLSSALLKAVHMLTDAQKNDRSLHYRHSIIIFSDGEVNAGETQPENLVHATREAIRQGFRYQDTLSGDLWINVSCVTTGTGVSSALYLLSKMCGSDAYLFVDGNNSSSKNRPEVDMLIPLLLRKTACAQTISVTVRGLNGAVLSTSRCSQEQSIRLRKGSVARKGREKESDTGGDEADDMIYFIHDMPRGGKKTFNLCLRVQRISSPDELFLSVDVEYVNPLGEICTFSKKIRRQEIVQLESKSPEAMEIIAKNGMGSLRQIFQETSRSITACLEESASDSNANDSEYVAASISFAVQTGRKKIKALEAEVLPHLDATIAPAAHSEFQDFSNAIKANLGKLGSALGGRGGSPGRVWQIAKAMSSAVVREVPTVSDVLVKPEVVGSPLAAAEVNDGTSPRMQALSVYVGLAPSPLFGAAQLVASSLAEVLEALSAAGTQ